MEQFKRIFLKDMDEFFRNFDKLLMSKINAFEFSKIEDDEKFDQFVNGFSMQVLQLILKYKLMPPGTNIFGFINLKLIDAPSRTLDISCVPTLVWKDSQESGQTFNTLAKMLLHYRGTKASPSQPSIITYLVNEYEDKRVLLVANKNQSLSDITYADELKCIKIGIPSQEASGRRIDGVFKKVLEKIQNEPFFEFNRFVFYNFANTSLLLEDVEPDSIRKNFSSLFSGNIKISEEKSDFDIFKKLAFSVHNIGNWYFYIPDQKKESIFVLYLLTNELVPDLYHKFLRKLIRHLQVKFRYICVNRANKKLLSGYKTNSIRSAISAIMSRNMSHNIGSHVLADLVAKMNFHSKDELSHFFRYLQNRMDFIAQITTDFPEWSYPTYFNKELMKIFFENFLLLNRIGVSEGLEAYSWPDNHEWKHAVMRGKIIVRTCLARRDCFALQRSKDIKIPSVPKWIINEYHMGDLSIDLQLAIPGGIVGYHAFYIIIENIIRNSAKHDYAVRLEDGNKNGSNKGLKDEVIFIESDEKLGYKTWEISSTLKDYKINNASELSERVKVCKALIVDSTCLQLNDIESERRDFFEHKNIKLLDGTPLEIPGGLKLFILCEDNPQKCCFTDSDGQCNCCLVVNKDFWQKKKQYYQVLTKKESDDLKRDTKEVNAIIATHDVEGSEQLEKRFINIVSYLRKGPLRVNIRIDDMIEKDYVWVTIWDNMRHKVSVNFDKSNDLNQEVTGNLKYGEMQGRVLAKNGNEDAQIINLFGYLNDRLRQSFVKDTGEWRREDWGLAELKICAGFLQNRRIEEIGAGGKTLIQYGGNCFNIDTKYEINDMDNRNYGCPKMLIKALPVDRKGQIFYDYNDTGKKDLQKLALKKDEFYYLGYRFWMKKPKNVALVRHETELKDKEDG